MWYAPPWQDWTDGAERIGMAVLLQQARFRGWGTEVDEALQSFAWFARECLVLPDGSVRRGSHPATHPLRLSNTAWLAHFFHDQFALYGDAADLDLAARLLEASHSLGARYHSPQSIYNVSSPLYTRTTTR